MSETDENRGMDLATFLLARIAEDEVAARVAPGAGRNWETRQGRVGNWAVVEDATALVAAETRSPKWAHHITRWEPARVLAECEAKRRIVEAESRFWRMKDNVLSWSTTNAPGEWVEVAWLDEGVQSHEERLSHAEFRERFTEPHPPSDTLRFLALPYADHPDYRDEWRP